MPRTIDKRVAEAVRALREAQGDVRSLAADYERQLETRDEMSELAMRLCRLLPDSPDQIAPLWGEIRQAKADLERGCEEQHESMQAYRAGVATLSRVMQAMQESANTIVADLR